MKSDVDKITIRMESVRENLNKTEFDDSEKELVMSAVEEVNSVLEYLRELNAYRATGYTPEQVQELHDKHWMECMQIAHYDNELNGNRGWIPVSERLPEDGQEALVITQKGKSVRFVRYNKTYNMFDIIGGLGALGTYSITHWMPLPEPPAEKGGVEE